MPPFDPSVSQNTSYTSPTPQGMATWKIIALILGGILLVAILGRVIWAYQAVKSDMAKVVQQTAQQNTSPAVTPASTEQPLMTTKSEVVKDTSTQNGITMNVNIKADVTTTTSCGTAGCFQQKFSKCQPATLDADVDFASVQYKIVGPIDSQHCRMMFKYTKSPNPDWTNKEMTCTYLNNVTYSDNPNSYEVQMGSMFTSVLSGSGGDDYDACEGPLYSLLQPEKAAVRASRQIPSEIKIGELNYSTIPINKLNEYIGKQVVFKVLNPEPEMKFCVGNITTETSGKVRASDEIIAHKCSGSPLVYNSANNMVSMPAFTAEEVTGLAKDFTDRGTGVLASFVLEFYAVDKNSRESNHLKFTITQ